MKVLIFAGAGTSVELGVPAMRAMAIDLSEHLQERYSTSDVVMKLNELLKQPAYDMEHLIEELDHMTAADATLKQWGWIENSLPEGLALIRQEVEWFVTHVCERIESAAALRLWGPVIDSLEDHGAVLVTTNYDRAIEIAATRCGVELYDGFGEFGQDEWTAWRGFTDPPARTLLKVHGSTDWYHAADGDSVWKLRHPMALFGRITMQVDAPQPLKLRSAAILPSREKKIALPPYPDLAYEFRRAIDQAELAVFVGTSLRDPDMRQLYLRSAQRAPTYLVGRSAQTPDGGNSVAIRQTASKFLAATLPTALISNNPVAFLNRQSQFQQVDNGILEDLTIATDIDVDPHRRCDAIERLANASASLPKGTILPLLRDDYPLVRTYALALVELCYHSNDLMMEARSIAEQTTDVGFREELAILEKMGSMSE